MSVQIGDRVQIKAGAVDVTNGKIAVKGKYYGEGGPLWCKVEAIIDDWRTGSKWGLPSTVTKVRCSYNGVVVWQVQPQDLADNIMTVTEEITVTSEVKTAPPKEVEVQTSSSEYNTPPTYKKFTNSTESKSSDLYAPASDAQVWTRDGGVSVKVNGSAALPNTTPITTQVVTGRTPFTINEPITSIVSGTFRDLNTKERKSIGPNMQIDQGAIKGANIRTAFQNPQKKRQMLNEDSENIMNQAGFPYKIKGSQNLISAKYNYQIIPGDKRSTKMIKLEDKLKIARAAFGIPVHGNNEIARAMKYYMYNRFKVPDTNMAHNKTFTYVFFTRPDLNILDPSSKSAVNQCRNHTEAAMIWKRYPEIFKLLTDAKRCGDDNNFNMLLSNQVRSFDIQDEQISTLRAGKSWHEQEIQYGDAYSGRGAGEFSCNFDEVADYSIINLIKLWITYIDMVSKGAWSPSYNLRGADLFNQNENFSHVFTKTLDYAASAYVFKCGPDGEDVLYWTKYYGVFPVNTGANALSWDGQITTDIPKLNIRFAYSAKKDMNPISLIEFNANSGVPLIGGSGLSYQEAWNHNFAHTDRPYVGAPFISLKLGNTSLVNNGVNYSRDRTQIRLKFKKYDSRNLTDDLLFKA